MSIPEYPSFSFSHSRAQALIACPRAYRHRYYTSWHGWKDDAPEQARLSFLLKHLTNLHFVLGSAIHNAARECIQAVIDCRPIPDANVIHQRVRAELNRVCLSSHQRQAFVRHPTQVPFLQDVWYHGQRNEEVVERVRKKMEACVSSLHATPLWEELRQLHPDEILIIDTLATFQFEQVSVFAAPDLVYRPSPERVVIVDFKTGSDDGVVEGIELQVPLYALYLLYGEGMTFAEGQWQGRVLSLLSGEEWWCDITSADLARAAERIHDGIASMRSYLADPEKNIPLGTDAFPLAEPRHRRRCPECAFYQLCEEELTEEAWRRFQAIMGMEIS